MMVLVEIMFFYIHSIEARNKSHIEGRNTLYVIHVQL
jgi:hypothetical protein